MRNEKLIGGCSASLVIQAIPLLIPHIRLFNHIHIINIMFGIVLLMISAAVVKDKMWGYCSALILSLMKLCTGILMCVVVENVSYWNHLSSFVASGVCIVSATILIKQKKAEPPLSPSE